MELGCIICYISALILAYIGNNYERLFHVLVEELQHLGMQTISLKDEY